MVWVAAISHDLYVYEHCDVGESVPCGYCGPRLSTQKYTWIRPSHQRGQSHFHCKYNWIWPSHQRGQSHFHCKYTWIQLTKTVMTMLIEKDGLVVIMDTYSTYFSQPKHHYWLIAAKMCLFGMVRNSHLIKFQSEIDVMNTYIASFNYIQASYAYNFSGRYSVRKLTTRGHRGYGHTAWVSLLLLLAC